ncbi:MAG: hypothetical protein QG588_110 [Candidatus Poribacteria bacterium]|nr:hypothetical protein [Candidatus Poribacteria bacterium]
MPVNSNKPERWKSDIVQSVDFYNNWFMRFAPKAYCDTRIETTKRVMDALKWTDNLADINPIVLRQNPSILPVLRMSTAPPIARDRLIGLAGISPNLVRSMEISKHVPPQMGETKINTELQKISQVIANLLDKEIFPWLETTTKPLTTKPLEADVQRAATIVADRLCGAVADPIIRNAQEQRQLAYIGQWLEKRGYTLIKAGSRLKFNEMMPGTFSFRLNVPVQQEGRAKCVNIPIDTVIMPLQAKPGDFPLLIEAKSAGDFTNTNKRRKEEATKVSQLRSTYGNNICFIIFLCGYFDSGYLGYEAAEGIDWVWEHRIDDLAELGI